jgi:hypothetical protein
MSVKRKVTVPEGRFEFMAGIEERGLTAAHYRRAGAQRRRVRCLRVLASTECILILRPV